MQELLEVYGGIVMINKILAKHLDSFVRYEIFIVVGILMSIGVLLKLFGNYNIDSDWFWLLAGLGLIVEGSISLVKQKRFDRKYKIIEIKECKNKS